MSITSIPVPEYGQALTANGDTTDKGYVTVTDNSGFFPGCYAWLSDNQGVSQRVVIVDLISTTLVGVRFVPDAGPGNGTGYGYSSTAYFTTAHSSRLDQPAQTATTFPSFSKRFTSEA